MITQIVQWTLMIVSGIFGLLFVLFLLLGLLVWLWETCIRIVNWVWYPPKAPPPQPPEFVVGPMDFWCEHVGRTNIREKRRQLRPAFILGLILVAGCAVTVCVADGRFELPVWLGLLIFLAAFMGLGLIISPGLELLSLRRNLANLKRKLPTSGMAENVTQRTERI